MHTASRSNNHHGGSAIRFSTGRLSFSVNDGQTVQARLHVSTDAFVLENGDSPWTTVPNPEVRRIPDGTIWGEIRVFDAADAALVGQFLAALEALGAAPSGLADGFYRAFEIVDGMVEPLSGSGVEPPPVGFAYRFDAGVGELPTLVAEWSADFGEVSVIRIVTSDGLRLNG